MGGGIRFEMGEVHGGTLRGNLIFRFLIPPSREIQFLESSHITANKTYRLYTYHITRWLCHRKNTRKSLKINADNIELHCIIKKKKHLDERLNIKWRKLNLSRGLTRI